jgi:hypothetical protein
MKPKSSGWRPNRVGFLAEVLGLETEIAGGFQISPDARNHLDSLGIGIYLEIAGFGWLGSHLVKNSPNQ